MSTAKINTKCQILFNPHFLESRLEFQLRTAKSQRNLRAGREGLLEPTYLAGA